MKKIIILLAILVLSLPVLAFELPTGKTFNPEHVENGIISYSKKIEASPNNEDAYINRAFLYFLLDNIEAAIDDYNALININPNNEDFYLNRGYLKHISHKREEALNDYNMAIKLNPNYAFAYNNRGVVLAEMGKNAESLTSYNAAIKIDPNYADAYYNRGNLKTNTHKNEEALEDFNIAIKLNPTDAATFNNRGVVKRKLNYNVGALSDFSIAIKLDPEDITAFANRGRLKKRYYDSEGAEEDFKQAIAIAEDSPIIVKQIEAQAKLTEMQKTIHNVDTQLKEAKIASDNIQKIGYLNNNQTNKQAVKASVLRVEPKSTKTTELPTPTAKKQETVITTKPVINPQLAECYYIRALQKYILQNRESALKDFDMAIKHNPNYAEAYYYRAAIKRDFQNEGFVDDYRKAVQLKPELKALNEADVLTILKI